MKHIIHEETWPFIDQFFQEMPEAIEKLPTFQDALAERLLASNKAKNEP